MSQTVPGPPQVYPRPAASAQQLEFWWAPPELQPGDPDIIGYQLECSSISYTSTLGPSSFQTRVPDLTNNQYYQFTLAAINSYGVGTPAQFRNVQAGLKATKNSIISANMLTSTTANVQWTFTQNPTEATNLGFAIIATPSTPTVSTLRYSAASESRNRIIENLALDVYTIKAFAVNDAGWQRLNTTNAITLDTQIYTALPTRARNLNIGSISWSSFTAQYTPGLNISFTSFLINNLNAIPAYQTAGTARFDNLNGSTQYGFSVVSNNNLLSVSTTQTIIQTRITPPTPITDIIVSNASPSSFTVNWTGGTYTSSYVYTFNGVPRQSIASTNTSASFDNLTVGTFYSIIVIGTNFSGQAISDVALITTTPNSPENVTIIDPRPTGFTVIWTQGSSGTTYYDISVDGGNTFTYTNVTSPYTINDLVRGVTYDVVVRAGNSSGATPALPPVSAKTGPAPPSNLQISNAALSSFTVSWDAGVEATSYNVSLDNGATFIANTVNLTYPFSGLSPGTTYQVIIQSQDDFLVTTNSAQFVAITYPVAPDNVTVTPLSVTQSGFIVIWTQSTGATSYGININSTGFVLVSSDPAVTTYTVSNMTPGSTPTVVVRASLVQPSNSEVQSTAASEITQLLKPATPDNLQSSSILSTSFTLSWTTSLGAASYDLSLDDGLTYPFTTTAVAGPVQTYNFTQLESGTTVQVVVKAINASGEALSATYNVLTRPRAPINIYTTNQTQTGFTVNWTLSVGADSYSIKVGGAAYVIVSVDPTVNKYVVTGLDEGSTNPIQLKATNQSGSTEASAINFLTKPSTPAAPTITGTTSTTIDISWTGGNGATTYIFLANEITVTASPYNYHSTPRTATLTGLAPSTTYDIVIIAVNSGGTSASSSAFAGLSLWLDAADPGATFTNGQTLTTWYDKSGYDNDATATAPSTQIIYQASNQTFVLTGSQFLRGDISIASDQLTILAVYIMNNTSDANARLVSLGQTGQNDSNNNSYLAFARQAQGFTPNRNGTQTAANYPASYSNPYLIETWFDGTNAYATVQNGPTTGILQTSSSGPFSISNYSLGASLAAVPSDYLNGSLAEILIYNKALSTEDRQNMEGYLSWKWGIQTNLPETNPNAPTATPPATEGPNFGATTITSPAPASSISITSPIATGFTVIWTNTATATSYNITATDVSGAVTNYTNATTPYEISNLTEGKTYDVVVISVNGPRTTNAAAVTGTTAPGAPSNLDVSNITNSGFTLTWTAGTGATSYNVSSNNGVTFTSVGNVLTHPFTGLSGGTSYTLIVQSQINSVKTNSSSTTALTKPDAPSTINASIYSQSGFRVTWNSVTGATSYSIKVNTGSFTSVGNTLFSDVTGLTAGTANDIVIRATNASGSTDSTVRTFYTQPSSISSLTAVSTTGSTISISWSGGDGGTSYLFYANSSLVQVSPSDFTSNPRTATITGLSANTPYDIRIESVNSGGATSSNTISVTSTGPPSAPILSSASVTSTGFTINWSGATGATSYSYSISPSAGSYTPSPSGTSGSVVWTGLTPSTPYTVIVTATNSEGSTPSIAFGQTTSAPPPAPTTPELYTDSMTSSSFTIGWTGGLYATSYTYKINDTLTTPTIDNGVSAKNATFSGTSGQSYTVEVIATNSTGSTSTGTGRGGGWIQQTGAPQANWQAFASSADGTKLVAGTSSSIYTSTDSGYTWMQRGAAGNGNWDGVASSADGTKLVSGMSNNGYIYTSSDSGNTWTARTQPGLGAWFAFASSADGTKLVTGKFGGNIYTSDDSGNTWTLRASPGTGNWSAFASSADGTKLVAGTNGSGTFTSTNSGATWNTVPGTAAFICNGIASSADGTKLVIGDAFYPDGGYIYTSTDSGFTITRRTGPGLNFWQGVASSADGTKLVVGSIGNQFINNPYIYTSIDSGNTWTRQTGPGTGNWRGVASSADGTKQVTGNGNFGYIYTNAALYTVTVL